jgi:putative sugar O-methyltransferase
MSLLKLNNILLNDLITGFKKNSYKNTSKYWHRRANRSLNEIIKKGIFDFRGHLSGIGIGYADHRNIDIRNILGKKEKMASIIFNLPILRSVYSKQLKLTKKYCYDYLNFKKQFYQNSPIVIKLLEKYKFENTVNFGAIDKIQYQNQDISTLHLIMANRMDFVDQKINLNEINSYCEIGGGFGANVQFLLSNFKNIKKVILIDIFPTIFILSEYLRSIYKKNVIDYTVIKQMNEIKFKKNNDLEIYCVPNFEAYKINDNIDHLHNAHSFVEMSSQQLEYYNNKIFKKYVKSASFIFYERNINEKIFSYKDVAKIFNAPFKEFELVLIESFKSNPDKVLIFSKD